METSSQSKAADGSKRAMNTKPLLGFFQIWNMAFGFFGLQIGFGLQNANASRVFQSLGANVDELALFWLAGPVTGLIMQPIVGYMSDKTWGRFGRRRPYFFIGALLASIALMFMPHSPALWIAVGSLWVLDASLNISMEPFRAFVGDKLSTAQRTFGYAMQGLMIGAGGWLASKLPSFLTSAGASNQADIGSVPESVTYAFMIGAVILFASVMWTIFTTKEYSPQELADFEAADTSELAIMRQAERPVPPAAFFKRWGVIITLIGAALTACVFIFNTEKQFIVFSSGVTLTGLMFLWHGALCNAPQMLATVLDDLVTMPLIMKRLALVQFATWFAFFIMWVYSDPAFAAHHFGTSDAASKAYGAASFAKNDMFAVYNLVPIGFSLMIPFIVRAIGLKTTYAAALTLGGLGLIAIYVLPMGQFLGDGISFGWFTAFQTKFFLSAIGIGIAWTCVLTLPYAILADALPAEKMGTYMGIFNFFIVLPQLVVGTVMGPVIATFFGGNAVYAIVLAGIVMIIGAALLLLFVPYKKPA
ncbi:MFS transporter [Fretibacter rubidus]|uniref:MFS transporter n=1 Tax=Fretibacter rubidus TaxID=570162 RepID=UPI00352ACF2F